MMVKLKKYLPNTFTAMNLAAGCLGLLAAYQGDLFKAAIFILIGAAFDFLDGFSARLLKATSEIGKQLDSLADMVTFALLPAFLVYSSLVLLDSGYESYLSMMIVIASAFRLAKFNIDDSQSLIFKGLPTPASAFLIAGMIFARDADSYIFSFMYDTKTGLLITTFIVTFLLNAPVAFLSFKINPINLKGNGYVVALIAVAILLVLMFGLKGLLPAVLFYILLSLIQNFLARNPGN